MTRSVFFAYRLAICLCVVAYSFFIIHKEHRNAPDTCESYNRVNNSRYYCGRTATDPGNQVEGEESDKTPVECTYYNKNKCQLVYNHHKI